MESRGQDTIGRSNDRPAISRRSCDQCRTRKIGCDRGSPCSNCISARVSCTHSAVASNATSPRHRVLISAQYERKIDSIANDIDGIKLLLQGLDTSGERKTIGPIRSVHQECAELSTNANEPRPITASQGEPQWDHSSHTIDFIKAIVQFPRPVDAREEANEILNSLDSLLSALERPPDNRKLPRSASILSRHGGCSQSMPPLAAVVDVLRWTKDHAHFFRIAWVSNILPLATFADICRKVYFAIDDYSEIEYVLTNGYLSFVFAESLVVSGNEDQKNYCSLCRENFNASLSMLPLLLPTSLEVIAVLTLGAFNAIETSRATVAWTFISAACDHCQHLGLHRPRSLVRHDRLSVEEQRSLFWVVHRLDKSLSMRLGRSSNIRDEDIILPWGRDESRTKRVARLQGKVFDELYSPLGLARSDKERGTLATAFAAELRTLLHEAHAEVEAGLEYPISGDGEEDPMSSIYPQFELVCESSLLTFVLRAIADSPEHPNASEDCIQSAREVLGMHEQCMRALSACKADPFVVTRYISWALMHVPFVPFNILFTHAVQSGDLGDLARIERFAASLRPKLQPSEEDASVHPHRLYELLCQAARLHITMQNVAVHADPTLTEILSNPLDQFELVGSSSKIDGAADWSYEAASFQASDLSSWFYDNQHIQSLLDDSYLF